MCTRKDGRSSRKSLAKAGDAGACHAWHSHVVSIPFAGRLPPLLRVPLKPEEAHTVHILVDVLTCGDVCGRVNALLLDLVLVLRDDGLPVMRSWHGCASGVVMDWAWWTFHEVLQILAMHRRTHFQLIWA